MNESNQEDLSVASEAASESSALDIPVEFRREKVSADKVQAAEDLNEEVLN